jgi:hypothetical protein
MRDYPKAVARNLCDGNLGRCESRTGSPLTPACSRFSIECILWISLQTASKSCSFSVSYCALRSLFGLSVFPYYRSFPSELPGEPLVKLMRTIDYAGCTTTRLKSNPTPTETEWISSWDLPTRKLRRKAARQHWRPLSFPRNNQYDHLIKPDRLLNPQVPLLHLLGELLDEHVGLAHSRLCDPGNHRIRIREEASHHPHLLADRARLQNLRHGIVCTVCRDLSELHGPHVVISQRGKIVRPENDSILRRGMLFQIAGHASPILPFERVVVRGRNPSRSGNGVAEGRRYDRDAQENISSKTRRER